MQRETLSVLLIGDDAERSASLQRQLSRAGEKRLNVTCVDRLDRALPRLRDQRFDAVVADLAEADGSAAEFVRKIHAEALDTPVVVIGDDADAAIEAVREGAQDYLSKQELTGAVLLRSIRYAIERNRTERRLMRMNQTLVRRVEERTGYIRLLQDVAIIANEADTVERALQSAVNRICRFMDWPVGHGYSTIEIVRGTKPIDVWYLSEPGQFWPFYEASLAAPPSAGGTSLRGAVSLGRMPLWVMDVAADDVGSARAEAARQAGLTTGFAFPVFVAQEVVALLEFFSTEVAEPGDGFLSVMAHVGTQLGRVVERRRLGQQLIEAVWNRQRELGQDLHDGLGQELTGIGMLAESLRRRLHDSLPKHAEAADELAELIRRSQQNLRRVSKGLLPVDVDAEGLRAALDELAAGVESQCLIPCRFRCGGDVLVQDNHVATYLFRIAQEAVNNAVKHARPKGIEIDLEGSDGAVRLKIRDDGVGIGSMDNGAQGIGLKTMKYRADVIGAALEIGPADEGGTLVDCTIRQKD